MAKVTEQHVFTDSYESIRYPLDRPGRLGLRRGQLGAIHALAGHLPFRPEPAIIVMPTGAGKTAVLMVTPFLQRSKRVLVVTPSRLVRGQIARNFEKLAILKELGVVPADAMLPKVRELKKRLTSTEAWQEIASADVVVTTPFTISPVIEGIAPPPDGFFDLLLIDEAHHLGAKTWRAVIDAFPAAAKALFTATPYRRDRREIRGVIALNYGIAAARADGVFGEIEYVPVKAPRGQTDETIARAAEKALRDDQANGFDHRLLVRASTVERGELLLKLYNRVTPSLRLELVHGRQSARTVDKVIERLRDGLLDGIVCVNMLGEGFDCPNLKIAALHAPHRSLGPTLQFIGRFARVTRGRVGRARFFAEPQELSGETAKLFSEEPAAWQELVQNLAEGRVAAEKELKDQLDSFTPVVDAEPEFEDLSLYNLRPKFHVKVYRVDEPVDLKQKIQLPPPFEVVHPRYSEEHHAAVLVTRERQKPTWASEPRLDRVEFDLFVVYYSAEAQLLFINATRKSEALYRAIATGFGATPKALPLYKMNRVLNGLTDVRCFSVGMRNRIHSSRHESYRMLAGSRAEQAVRRTDGRLFHRGHVSCAAIESGDVVTIGYSPSKIWSSSRGHIPDLLEWCRSLAKKMSSDGTAAMVPGLDHLSVGEPLKTLPKNVLAADWDYETWDERMEFSTVSDKGEEVRRPLTELSLRIDRDQSTASSLRVVAECDEQVWQLDFTPFAKTFFAYATPPTAPVTVHVGDDELPLPDYLNEYPLHFYFADFSRLRGDEWFPCKEPADAFNRETIKVVEWDKANVDKQKELWKDGKRPKSGKLSIHDYLEQVLDKDPNAVVFYDHRSGEVADFLVIHKEGQLVIIALYHCKGAGGENARDRVGDVYEVCGQVIKSFHLLGNDKELLRHVKRRSDRSKFVRGNVATVEKLVQQGRSNGLAYQFVIVQPGVSKSKLTDQAAEVLSAAAEHVHQLGARELSVWGSL
jgi:superfamily II DNA or RNA helicase